MRDNGQQRNRGHRGKRDSGQATAEYALVLLGAATIALVLLGWATGVVSISPLHWLATLLVLFISAIGLTALALAIAWARDRAVISHESGLLLHGLSDVNPSVVHVTAPVNNYPRAQGSGPVRIHRRDLPDADVTTIQGLPVTTVVRTITDCHEWGTDPAQLRLAIDQGRQSGELTPAQALSLGGLIEGRGETG